MKKTLIAASLGLTLLAGTSSVFAHDYDHRSNGDAVAATMIGAIAGAMLSQNTGYSTGYSYYQPYGYPGYYNAPAYYNTPTYYYQAPVVHGYYRHGYYRHDYDRHDWHHHDRDHYDRGHHEHHDWR